MTMSLPNLTILDVGHGLCVVLQDAMGTVIFDAGSGATLLEFLRESGITEIDEVIISHADADHLSGLVSLLSSGKVHVRQVHLNSDSTKGSDIWEDLQFAVADATEKAATRVVVGITTSNTQEFSRGEVQVEILYPSPAVAMAGPGGTDLKGRGLTSNSMSVVARITHRSEPRVMLTGDIDAVGLENLLEAFPSPKSDVLVFPHHGGRPSRANPWQFANRLSRAVEPNFIVFSIGRGRYGTPRSDIVEGIRSVLPDATIACTQLSTNCAASLPPAEPTHLAHTAARGRINRSCCAGSIRLVLEHTAAQSAPSLQAHQEFITANAPSAMCRRVWRVS